MRDCSPCFRSPAAKVADLSGMCFFAWCSTIKVPPSRSRCLACRIRAARANNPNRMADRRRRGPILFVIAAGEILGGEIQNIGLCFRDAKLVEILLDQRARSF